MKLTLEPTGKIIDVDGQRTRVWQGEDEQGTPVQLLVCRVFVPHWDAAVRDRFAAELHEVAPSRPDVAALPAYLVSRRGNLS